MALERERKFLVKSSFYIIDKTPFNAEIFFIFLCVAKQLYPFA